MHRAAPLNRMCLGTTTMSGHLMGTLRGGGIRMRRECKTRFLEHGWKEMGLCTLRKDRRVGNESHLQYTTSWLKAELALFFRILRSELYD